MTFTNFLFNFPLVFLSYFFSLLVWMRLSLSFALSQKPDTWSGSRPRLNVVWIDVYNIPVARDSSCNYRNWLWPVLYEESQGFVSPENVFYHCLHNFMLFQWVSLWNTKMFMVIINCNVPKRNKKSCIKGFHLKLHNVE